MSTISPEELKAHAAAMGFDLCGIAAADQFPELQFLEEWIARGYHGEMHYMERTAERRTDVRAVLPSARSVIMLATVYNTGDSQPAAGSTAEHASIARYAWGDDYHTVITARMERLIGWLRERVGDVECRAYVDTGPVQERVYAKYAGLGWIGKNTCLINQQLGSWLFLSAIISDLPLEADRPPLDHCGRCTLCLDACPTGALVAPYQLDARRCISYLSIEVKGDIPVEFRDGIGHHAYGCDICQEVCPWNRKAGVSDDPAWQARPGLNRPRLLDLWNTTDDGLRGLLKGSAMKRAGVKRLRRNLAVAIGNACDPAAADALVACDEPTAEDPLVRRHVEWATGKLRG